MNLRNQIVGGVGIVTISLIAVVAYLYTNLDAIVKRELERYGSDLTGTVVRVDSVEISPSSGRGVIRGLTIANPPGYSAGNAFELEEITLQIRPSSIASDLVVVDQVVVESPRIHFVMGGVKDSNIGKIVDNVKSSNGGDSESPESSPDSAETRMVVRRFSFQGGGMNVESRVPLGKALEVQLPALSMNDVGGAAGASPSAVGKEILVAYLTKVAVAVATTQIQKVVASEVGKVTGKIPGPAGDAIRGVVGEVFNLIPGAKPKQ